MTTKISGINMSSLGRVVAMGVTSFAFQALVFSRDFSTRP